MMILFPELHQLLCDHIPLEHQHNVQGFSKELACVQDKANQKGIHMFYDCAIQRNQIELIFLTTEREKKP